MNKFATVPVVYGNHGKSPAQLEDYHLYLTQALESLGYEPLFCEEIIPGRFNILIEYFSSQDVFKVSQAMKTPGTRFICIATEFITGMTFNDFEMTMPQHAVKRNFRIPRWLEILGSRLIPVLFPEFLRALVIELLPTPYFRARQLYYAWFGYPTSSIYSAKNYWRDRFRFFNLIVPYCEDIWCVTPHQMDEYRRLFGDKVHLMPIASWKPNVQNALQGKVEKDIDFLFTGSTTPYREAVFKCLREMGYTVFVGPATLPTYLREHFIARSKVCLQVRQNGSWKYPSIMRYHYLLCSGATVIAEQTDETCPQEEFIITSKPKDFVQNCIDVIQSGKYAGYGTQACLNYYQGSASGREDFAHLLPKRTVKNERILEPSVSHH